MSDFFSFFTEPERVRFFFSFLICLSFFFLAKALYRFLNKAINTRIDSIQQKNRNITKQIADLEKMYAERQYNVTAAKKALQVKYPAILFWATFIISFLAYYITMNIWFSLFMLLPIFIIIWHFYRKARTYIDYQLEFIQELDFQLGLNHQSNLAIHSAASEESNRIAYAFNAYMNKRTIQADMIDIYNFAKDFGFDDLAECVFYSKDEIDEEKKLDLLQLGILSTKYKLDLKVTRYQRISGVLVLIIAILFILFPTGILLFNGPLKLM